MLPRGAVVTNGDRHGGRILAASLTAVAMMAVPVTDVSAQLDREEFSAALLVTGVTNDPDPRVTPNDKWELLEGKEVTAAGVATIGTSDESAELVATLWGKLNPDGPVGTDWSTFTLSLDAGDLECHGALKVERYVATAGPVPHGESGNSRADCDSAKVMGHFVGEFGLLGDDPGFLVTTDGTAR
jgi:hypothetical protein